MSHLSLKTFPKRILVPLAMGGSVGAVLLAMFVLRSNSDSRYQALLQVPRASENEHEHRDDGDTPLDTIKALQAYAKAAVDRAEALHAANAEHAEQVLINQQAIARVKDELEGYRQFSTEGGLDNHAVSIQSMAERLNTLERRLNEIESADPVSSNFSDHPTQNNDLDAVIRRSNTAVAQTGRWFNSLEHEGQNIEGSFSFTSHDQPKTSNVDWNGFDPAEESVSGSKSGESFSTPYYTLPKDAMLTDALALTALIGRIPVAGTTPDPYPVKVFIGRENLMANGHQLPDIEGMIFSGLGFGDWNLRCVNARLYSATYIFDDGSVVNHSSEGEPLAYLSDPQGVPCIAGELKTNAPAFVAQSMGLAGLNAAGSIYAQGQQSLAAGGTEVLESLTESMARAGLGKVVSAATDEVSRWLLERQQQSFDAVVVPPGASVAVHLEQSLPIDYSPNNRRVRYESSENFDRPLD